MAKQELSSDLKLVLVLVFLFVLYPVGLVLMFKWMKWPMWVKLIISLPVFLILFGFIALFMIFLTVAFSNRDIKQNSVINENTCTKECAETATDNTMNYCIQKCIQISSESNN